VPVYRKKAPAVWLLIVVRTEGLHSILDFDRDILTASYTTAFDGSLFFAPTALRRTSFDRSHS